jgi:3-oxoacyl-[acyl-carrier protein] reductase
MLLKDKTAVITGCLKGIGRTTMRSFAKNGANIWAFSEKQTEEFEEDIAELSEKYNVLITPVYVDLFETEEIKKAIRTIHQSKRNVDILVNIAGITSNALLNMTTMENMKRVFELNFFSQIFVTQNISKIMMKQKSGSIINISSVSAIDGNRGQVAYSASKAALIGATKTLSSELSEYGIRVNAIAPGVIETSMTAELDKDDFQILVNKTNLGRAGKPDEVANVLLFLASDLSSYITGQVIRVDGGM